MPRQALNLVVAMSPDRGPIGVCRVSCVVTNTDRNSTPLRWVSTKRARSSLGQALPSLPLITTRFLLAAAYGGAAAVAASGNQIFVTLQKGNEYPPLVVDVRVKYEQTVSDIRAAVARKTGVPADKQQLFWHQKELTTAYDHKTLLEMHLHTGFSLKGYDLVSPFALPI